MAEPETISIQQLMAALQGEVNQTQTTTPTSNNAFNKLLQDLLKVNQDMFKEMQKAKNYTKCVCDEIKKLNSFEKKESSSSKKAKDFDKSLKSSSTMKRIEKILLREEKEKTRSATTRTTARTKGKLDLSSYSQFFTGADTAMAGITNNIIKAAEKVVGLESSYGGLVGKVLSGVDAQAKFTQEIRATLYETANVTSENKKLFSTLEDIENITRVTGFSQQKAQENIVKLAKSGIKYEGNAVKYRDKLVSLTESQLSTEKQIGLEAGDLFDTFNKLYQAGRLTEGEIADIGRGMRDIARQTGLTGKNLQQAFNAAQPILDAMRKAATLTATAVKNVTQGIAESEKLGVTEQTKTLLEAASSTTNLFYNASKETQALLYMAAGTVGKIGDLQKGVLTRSKEGIKSLSTGISNVLKKFGVESLEAIDNLSDAAKMKLNLNLKAAFGLEIGELRGVVESLGNAGKGFGERVADIEKKLKTNLTLEEKTALLEEKRRLQVSQSLEALTVLDKAAVGAKNMEDALSKFGDKRKEFEKDLQALGLRGTNKEVIKGALEEAIKGIEVASKKSLGITSTEIQKALEDPVSFRELTSKITKAEQASATKQKTQLDAVTETNQILEDIKTEVQRSTSSIISSFMSNAGPLGLIASNLALIAAPSIAKGIGGRLMGGGAPAPAPDAAPPTSTIPAAPTTSRIAGYGTFAKNFLVGMTGLVAAAGLIYLGIKGLQKFGPDIDIESLVEPTKKLAIIFGAVTLIAAEVATFSGVMGAIAKITSFAGGYTELLKAGVAIGLISLGMTALAAAITWSVSKLEDPSEVLKATEMFAKISFSLVTIIGACAAAAAALIGISFLISMLTGPQALIAVALLAVAAIGVPLMINGMVSFLNKVGSVMIEAASQIYGTSELQNASDKLTDYVSAGGRFISGLLGALWEINKLQYGGGVLGLTSWIASVFGASPEKTIRKTLDSIFSIFSGFITGLDISENQYGINPENLNSTIAKLDKYKEINKKLIKTVGELTESFSGIIGTTSNTTKELYESTKNIPPAKIKETLDGAKSMVSMFSDFVGTAKEFDKNLNDKNLEQLRKIIGDSKLPEILKSVFGNVEKSIKATKSYAVSSIELKALSERINLVGLFIKGIGNASTGIKDAVTSFDEIQKSKSIKSNVFDNPEEGFGNFFEKLFQAVIVIKKVLNKYEKDFNVTNIGSLQKTGENVSKLLGSIKDLISNFDKNVLKEMAPLVKPDGILGKLKQQYTGGNWNLKNWVTPDVFDETELLNVVNGFGYIIQAVIMTNNTLTEYLGKIKTKNDNVKSIESELKINSKKLELISSNFKHIGNFISEFKNQIIPSVKGVMENKKLIEIKKYQGTDDEYYSDISDTFWNILVNVMHLNKNLNEGLENISPKIEGKNNETTLNDLSAKLILITNNLQQFSRLFHLINKDILTDFKKIQAPDLKDLEDVKQKLKNTFRNLEITLLNKEFVDSLLEFTNKIPKFPTLNITNFASFAESLKLLTNTIATSFAFLGDELPKQDIKPDEIATSKKTIADHVKIAKEFFKDDFVSLLTNFTKTMNFLKSSSFNEEDFEKSTKLISSFSKIAGSVKELTINFGAIGYELQSSIGNTTQLEYIRDLIKDPKFNKLGSLIRELPVFIYNNLIVPLSNAPRSINPKTLDSIVKIIEGTAKTLSVLGGSDGLFNSLAKNLNIDELDEAIKYLEKFKKSNDLVTIYGKVKNSSKTSYMLADFIISLIENVINPLSKLNRVTSPKSINYTADIVSGILKLTNILPELVTAVSNSIDKLLDVDDENINNTLIEATTKKLKNIGEHLPKFVVSLYNYIVWPLSQIPISPKGLGDVANKITSIKTIATNLPDLVKTINENFPELLKNMQDVDASLAKKLNAKGETFKDLFVGLLKFLVNGIVYPLLSTKISPKHLDFASNQIENLIPLTEKIGPLLLKIQESLSGIPSLNLSALATIFAESDLDLLNADALENALISFAEQLDRIVDIMSSNVEKINAINSLGEIKINTGEISTATNAEIPESKAYDMFSQSLQMKESSGSTSSESNEELVEINKDIRNNQDEMIELLTGIFNSLNIPIPSSNNAETKPFKKASELNKFQQVYSAKLQTGTVNRTSYISGNNLISTATGPIA